MNKDLYQACITFAACLTCSSVTYAVKDYSGLIPLFIFSLAVLFAVLAGATVKQ